MARALHFVEGADAEEEEKASGEDGDVEAGDDQRVISTGAAEVFGPDFFELRFFADENGLHHAGGIGVGRIEFFDAVDGGGAEGDRLRTRISIRSGRGGFCAAVRRAMVAVQKIFWRAR